MRGRAGGAELGSARPRPAKFGTSGRRGREGWGGKGGGKASGGGAAFSELGRLIFQVPGGEAAEAQIGQTAVLGGPPRAAPAERPRGGARQGRGQRASGLLPKETAPGKGAECSAATVLMGWATPGRGGRCASRAVCLQISATSRNVNCQPFRFCLWSGLSGLSASAPGETAGLSCSGKKKKEPKPHRLCQAELACCVGFFFFRPRKRARLGSGEALPPRSVAGCFGQELPGSSRAGGGKVRLPRAAGATGAARVAQAGLGGKVRESPSERLEALLRQA